MTSRVSSERGAILIQVAVASVVLIAFSMFVVDYGIMWVSRGQAQNSADAGALAGAVALGYDAFEKRADYGPGKQAAQQFALQNTVFGEAPDVKVRTDVIFYRDDREKFPVECADDTCIRVDVYRNQGRLNPLPMIFGQLVGMAEQGVRATAIARAAFGNATDCLKPWAVIDRWKENWEDGAPAKLTFDQNPDPDFDGVSRTANGATVLVPDVYKPVVYKPATPSSGETYEPGTGYRPYSTDRSSIADYGRQFRLKTSPSGSPKWGGGWFMALDIGDCGPGADCYRNNIVGCVRTVYKIGDRLKVEPGDMAGPTAQGVEGGGPVSYQDSLIGRDPDARWDQSLNGGRGGVVGSKFETSPRIVAIPLVDPAQIFKEQQSGSTVRPQITNIAGFFVERLDGSEVVGRIVTLPGMITAEATPSSFLFNISLIR